MEKDIEIGSVVCSKENRDMSYTVTGKKHLNNILHYQLESDSGKIYLSEFAVKDRFIKVDERDQLKKPVVSRLYTKITDTVHKS